MSNVKRRGHSEPPGRIAQLVCRVAGHRPEVHATPALAIPTGQPGQFYGKGSHIEYGDCRRCGSPSS